MTPRRRGGVRGLRAAIAALAGRSDWLDRFLLRHAPSKTSRALHLEKLEDRFVWSGSPWSEMVSPEWFQDYTDPHVASHAGPGAWSASAEQEGLASVGGAADTYDWIVRFDTASLDGITSAAQTTSLLAASGIQFDVLRGLGLVGQVLVRSTGATPDEVRAWLAADKDVAGFEQDEIHQVAAVFNDPRRSELWGLDNSRDADIDAPAAWDITTGSRSVVVAVVDTGVDYNHPDLAANIWTNPREIPGNGRDDDGNGFVDDVHGYNFAYNTSDPMDDQGHGTHVSGTIAAVGNNGVGVVGVNWSASIMALKFLDDGGSGYTSDAVRAINYREADFVEAIRTVARSHGPFEAMIGHSLGAAACALAVRDGLPVSRIVLLAPPAEAEKYTGRFARFFGIPPATHAEMKRRLERRYRIRWSDLRVAGGHCLVRALVLHDPRDGKVPFRDGQEVVRTWPNAKLIRTRGVGHHRILTNPKVIADAVSFVSGAPEPPLRARLSRRARLGAAAFAS